MKKPYRYVLYFFIGFLVYYLIGADENPEVLRDFHSMAPALILTVAVLLVVVRIVIEKKKSRRNEE